MASSFGEQIDSKRCYYVERFANFRRWLTVFEIRKKRYANAA